MLFDHFFIVSAARSRLLLLLDHDITIQVQTLVLICEEWIYCSCCVGVTAAAGRFISSTITVFLLLLLNICIIAISMRRTSTTGGAGLCAFWKADILSAN